MMMRAIFLDVAVLGIPGTALHTYPDLSVSLECAACDQQWEAYQICQEFRASLQC
jgi:hypothetical protein